MISGYRAWRCRAGCLRCSNFLSAMPTRRPVRLKRLHARIHEFRRRTHVSGARLYRPLTPTRICWAVDFVLELCGTTQHDDRTRHPGTRRALPQSALRSPRLLTTARKLGRSQACGRPLRGEFRRDAAGPMRQHAPHTSQCQTHRSRLPAPHPPATFEPCEQLPPVVFAEPARVPDQVAVVRDVDDGRRIDNAAEIRDFRQRELRMYDRQ